MQPPDIGSSWRHKKRGSVYRVVANVRLRALAPVMEGDLVVVLPPDIAIPQREATLLEVHAVTKVTAKLQAAAKLENGTDLVLYVHPEDGQFWVRPASEFMDGRFERIEGPDPSPAPAGP